MKDINQKDINWGLMGNKSSAKRNMMQCKKGCSSEGSRISGLDIWDGVVRNEA